MWKLPSMAPRSGRALIALLFGLKLALLIWNAAVFDGKSYDADFHADRALVAGLSPSKLTHDGPAYYLAAKLRQRPEDVPLVARATGGEEGESPQERAQPVPRLARAEKEFRDRLLDWLRYTNVLWLGLFYAAWIYGTFPRLLPRFEGWFLASLLLLALPGYQRVGVMSHPDNLFLGLSALAVAGWVMLRERWLRSRVEPESGFGIRFWQLGLFALTIGVMAATRSFAIVPAVVLGGVGVLYAIRSARGDLTALGLRVLAVLAISGGIGLSWYGALSRASHAPGASFSAKYFPTFEPSGAGFDYARYYTSFRVGRLLDTDPQALETPADSLENSFFTLIYSETWGDHWSSFVNPKAKRSKEWPKRALLVCALAVPPSLLALAITALVAFVRRVRQSSARAADDPASRRSTTLAAFEPELVLTLLVGLGAAVFVYWQAKLALFPNDNSTIRFGYVAWLFPPALALLFGSELKPWASRLLSAYFLILYCVAFPVAMYWPS